MNFKLANIGKKTLFSHQRQHDYCMKEEYQLFHQCQLVLNSDVQKLLVTIDVLIAWNSDVYTIYTPSVLDSTRFSNSCRVFFYYWVFIHLTSTSVSWSRINTVKLSCCLNNKLFANAFLLFIFKINCRNRQIQKTSKFIMINCFYRWKLVVLSCFSHCFY